MCKWLGPGVLLVRDLPCASPLEQATRTAIHFVLRATLRLAAVPAPAAAAPRRLKLQGGEEEPEIRMDWCSGKASHIALASTGVVRYMY